MGRFSEHRDSRSGEPHGPPPATADADVVAFLEEIRAAVHRWIDTIEERLDDEARLPKADRDLEQAFRELEQQRDALRAEAERRDRELAERLDALEHDRRLLAEAWERLEQERVSAVPPTRAAQDPASKNPPVVTSRAAIPGMESDNPVDQTILRQFEALRRDVRRKTETQRLP